MSTSVLLNLGSLLLGLISWGVPILAMKRFMNDGVKKCYKYILVSFSSCLISLCLQFFEINHRVEIEDLSAIMDTIGVLKWVTVILILITIVLNTLVLGICYEKEGGANRY